MASSPGGGDVGGYEEALVRYGLDVCDVWCAAGKADTCADTLVADLTQTTGMGTPRSQEELAVAGEPLHGWGTMPFTAATNQRSRGKMPHTIARIFEVCPKICRTSGPRQIAIAACPSTSEMPLQPSLPMAEQRADTRGDDGRQRAHGSA